MFQSFTALNQFLDSSVLVKSASLLLLPFAYGDFAITLGGYIVVNDLMSATLVGLSLYCVLVVGDVALYGLGAAGHHVPWLGRYAQCDRALRIGEALKANVFGLVALCRVVPGLLVVAFVACGWARVSLARFSAASLISAALYLPLMLYLVVVFGDALDDRLGFWAWPMLLLLIAATGFVRNRVFDFHDPDDPEGPVPPHKIVGRGTPSAAHRPSIDPPAGSA